ncbi:MAG TPA: acyl-CoA dehydrogenase family protein, partial [Phenylobacterium sp.]|nr:acyl-CoA dehydrogenase family protein [Phenylobacterium sp.]
MNFDFSDDQKFLKSEARKFLDANSPPERVRAVLDDDGTAYDQALWKSVAEQGWLGAAIPEEYGGLGLGHLELCVIAEELGRAVAPIPFASTVYFLAEAIMLAGSDEQKSWLLPKIAAGEVIGAIAT